MESKINNKYLKILGQIKILFKSGAQTQIFNDSLEYWSNIEDTEHEFNLTEYNYRCIVDGEIVKELIIH
jgi:hypothetical protein